MVRTRIAPSPTGMDLHVGNLYTAYLNWAYAKHCGGKFIVRIEDTDRIRLVPGSEEKIVQTLADFGIQADESISTEGEYGPYRQSDRLAIYTEHAQLLIDSGAAYYCTCTSERLGQVREEQKKNKQLPRYDRYCVGRQAAVKTEIEGGLKYVIRLSVPKDENITFTDVLRGEITISSNELDDQVLLKSDGFPTYHLAVVVDDHLMKISHIIRAEEWIASTPKHILLYRAFGWELPVFAHVPILRNPDKSKLSKRKNPVWASWYLEQGFLSQAMLNYFALMGWSHPEGKEIFTVEEFQNVFDIKDMKAVGPVFDVVKLEWMNGEYIRQTQRSKLKDQIVEFFDGKYSEELVEKLVPLVQDRIKTLKEFDEYCSFFLAAPESYVEGVALDSTVLKASADTLESLDDWTADAIGEALQSVATKLDMKNGPFFMMMRVAVTGKKVTPPLNESLEILGKAEVLKRLRME